ncbi:hypothetical protein F3Y22_tig00111810pilonHSYRG00255 [Hibiscus syriacus]|uniref:Uncharacterized protein n=1 Tax=Hibiscus syriacus TaxID=106335 RepID=A0A6A2XTH8_HIBSY|nr:hypothetical protein F3Y22_tig00111810pilonHSYRG00255 [Hibiscus syriacus]
MTKNLLRSPERPPDVLINLAPTLREDPKYQGQYKLPIIVWMIAQATQGDLAVGLYMWVHVLLPMLSVTSSCNPQSRDLILQLVERLVYRYTMNRLVYRYTMNRCSNIVAPEVKREKIGLLKAIIHLPWPGKKKRLVNGLRPRLKEILIELNLSSFQEVINHAKALERAQNERFGDQRVQTSKRTGTSSSSTPPKRERDSGFRSQARSESIASSARGASQARPRQTQSMGYGAGRSNQDTEHFIQDCPLMVGEPAPSESWFFLAKRTRKSDVSQEVAAIRMSRLSPDREVEFQIEVMSGTTPIAMTPYQMAPKELQELKNRLWIQVDPQRQKLFWNERFQIMYRKPGVSLDLPVIIADLLRSFR